MVLFKNYFHTIQNILLLIYREWNKWSQHSVLVDKKEKGACLLLCDWPKYMVVFLQIDIVIIVILLSSKVTDRSQES
jgi:hypothetical protein